LPYNRRLIVVALFLFSLYMLLYNFLIANPSVIIGLFMGALSAFFLKSLTYVTDVRLANPWLLFILPISGVVCNRAKQC
jgi:hypothetical protein